MEQAKQTSDAEKARETENAKEVQQTKPARVNVVAKKVRKGNVAWKAVTKQAEKTEDVLEAKTDTQEDVRTNSSAYNEHNGIFRKKAAGVTQELPLYIQKKRRGIQQNKVMNARMVREVYSQPRCVCIVKNKVMKV